MMVSMPLNTSQRPEQRLAHVPSEEGYTGCTEHSATTGKSAQAAPFHVTVSSRFEPEYTASAIYSSISFHPTPPLTPELS